MFKYVKLHKFTGFFYFTVAALLKTRNFLPLYHFTSRIRDMKQSTVRIGSKHSNIYQKAYQHGLMNICVKVLYFSSISLWYRVFCLKTIETEFALFQILGIKGFSKSVWTCYFCLQMSFTQVSQRYHPSVTSEY